VLRVPDPLSILEALSGHPIVQKIALIYTAASLARLRWPQSVLGSPRPQPEAPAGLRCWPLKKFDHPPEYRRRIGLLARAAIEANGFQARRKWECPI
jgi:hypothetical protein